MVMRIKFVKELNKETGLMTTANEPFYQISIILSTQ